MNEGAPIIIKKKKVSGHGHHGGAWKVAYADFVTAMMAFFLVMWIMGMSADDREQVQGYFNDPMGFMKSVPKGAPNIGPTGGKSSPRESLTQGNATKAREEDEQQLKTVEQSVNKALGSGAATGDLATLLKNIEISITPEGLEIEFVEGKGMVFFEVGSDKVRPQARQLILRVAGQLRGAGRMMFIDGHTDGRPFVGGSMDNKLLSAQRAQAVYRLLRQGGVPEAQVMDIRGRGSRKLKYPDNPLDDRNRRVSILLPFKDAEERVVNDLPVGELQGAEAAFRSEIKIVPPPPSIAPSQHEH